MSESEPQQRTTIEKYSLTILVGVLLGLLAWGGNKLDAMTDRMARTEERVAAMNHSLNDILQYVRPYRGDRR